MSRIIRRLIATPLIALLILGAVPSTAFAGTVTLSVSSGGWGTSVSVTGSGWTSRATTTTGPRVSVGAQQVAICATNNGGALQGCTITIPDLGPGVHAVSLVDGTTASNTATTNFTITSPTATITPTSGPGNTSVTLSGTGFSASVALTFTADGAAMTQSACTTTATGSFSGCTATVPWGEAGTVAIAATQPSGRTASASYTRSLTKGTATVSPTSSHWGSSVTVTGTGWPVSKTGGATGTGPIVRFDGAAVVTCATDGTGALSACTFPVPNATVGAGHTITVTDQVNSFNNTSQPYTINAPSITLSPATGAGGSTLTIGGGGFRPSASVELLFDGELRTSTPTCATNASGVFSGCAIVVPFRPAGTYNVVARDVSGTGTQRSASASYGLSLTPGSLSISPTSGPGGTTVTVAGASGWTPNATTSNGPIVALDGPQVTRCATTAGGALSGCSFTAPSLAAGTYTVLVTDGSNAYNSNTASFTVNAPTITLGATTGTSGSSVDVTGSGFRANATIEFAFGATASRSTCTANQWGVISGCSITVPSLPTLSGVSVTAADLPAGGLQRTATSTNTFTPTTTLTLSTTSGAPGDVITVTGAGWSLETIQLRWGSPATAIGGASNCTADITGALTGCSFTIPAGATGGPTMVEAATITGVARSASAYFEVFRDTALTVDPVTAVYGDNATLSATLARTNGLEALAGRTVSFSVGGTPVGTANTNASGIATLADVDLLRRAVAGSPHAAAITATVPASGYDRAAIGSAAITITPRSLAGSFTAGDKTYDATTAATISGRSVAGVLSGDTVTLTSGTATFDTKDVGAGKIVTGTGFTLSGAEAANYQLASTSLTTTASVTAKAATIGVTAGDKVYDGTTAATIAGRSVTGVVAGDVVSATGGTATFAGKAAGVGKAVSVTGLSLTGTDAANYTSNTTAAATAAITARPLAVTATAANKVYDRTTAASVTLGDNRIAGDTLTITHDPATFATATVGELKTVTVPGIVVAGADAANYTANASTSALADITPEGVTVTFTAPNRVYDGTWTATADSVSLTGVRSGDDVTVTGGTVVFLDRNVGTGKTVRWNGFTLAGADAANYTLASDNITTTATITARPLTVSAASAGKIYDGTTSAAVTLSDNRVAGDALSVGYTVAAYATKTAEAGKTIDVEGIDVTGTDAGNYTWNTQASATATITARPVTVTVAADDKVYDASTAATATLGDDRIAGDVLTVNTTGATFASKTVGTGKTVTAGGLSLTGADAGNYSVPASATGTADITARALVAAFTVDPKVYDGTTSAVLSDAGLTGVQGADDVSLAGATASFASAAVANPNTATISGYSLTGADAANYTVNPTATDAAAITPRSLTVTATAATRVYDGTDGASVTLSDDRVAGDTLGLSYDTATFDSANVGAGKPVAVTGIAVSGDDAANYTAATTAATTGTIVARTLTVTAAGVDKTYDGTAAAAVELDDDRVDGDTLSLSYGAAAFDAPEVGADRPVSVTELAVAGADAGNYELSSTSAATTADITARALTVTATGDDKVYDGTTAATITLSDDRVSGDVLDTDYAEAAFATKNVNAAKPVNVTGITLDGPDAGNYTVNPTASATAAITARALTVTAAGANKVYDGDSVATVTLSDNRVAGDDVAPAYGQAAFAEHNTGTAKAVWVTGITLSGADAANYTANPTAATTADITPKPVTAAFTAGNKTYNGLTTAAVTGSTVQGALGGDDVALTAGTAAFDTKHAGAGKTVTWTGFALTGNDAANYELANSDATTTADVTARALTVTATADSKPYDGNRTATVTLSDDRVAGDALSVTAASALFDTPDVGAGKAVDVTGIAIGSGADAGNYTLANSTVSTTADVTDAAALTVSFTAAGKTYDATTAATVTGSSLTGVNPGDDVTLTGGTATFDLATAGSRTVTWSGFSLAGADAANYDLAATTATTAATISAKALTVTASADDRVYDGTTVATAALNSAQIVAGDTVTFTGTAAFDDEHAGNEKTVTVSDIAKGGADAGNYTLANTTTTATADITARPLTVTAAAQDKVYDGTASATVSLSDDRLAGDALTLTADPATFDAAEAGADRTVTVSGIAISGGADAGNYVLGATSDTDTADIAVKPLTVTATGTDKVYDSTAAASVTLATADVVADDAVSLAATGAAFDTAAVGIAKPINVVGITIAGVDAANYALANNTAEASANVTARALTVTATATDRVYDATTAATAQLATADVLGDDDVTLDHAGAAFRSAGVGTDKAVDVSGISIAGADAANYALTSATALAAADITPRTLDVSASGVDKVYDGTTAATVTLSDDRVAGDTLTVTYGTASFDRATVGAGTPITVTELAVAGADASNYELRTTTAAASAAITAKPLTATAGAADKIYDGTTAATVALATAGVVGTDDVDLNHSNAVFDSKTVGGAKPVSVTGISLSGADAGNYELASTSAAASADITAKALTVTAAGSNRVYDATTDATVTLSTDDRIDGDTVTLAHDAAVFDTPVVGTAKPVTVSGIGLVGADAANYALTSTTATTTADITAKALTAAFTAADRTYDGTVGASITDTTLTGVLSGDDVTVDGPAATFADKTVGADKTVTIAGYTLAGDEAGNYSVNPTATTQASIVTRGLTPAATAQSKAYDGETTATVTLSDDALAGDVVTLSHAGAAFDSRTVGNGKTVAVSGIAISGGADAPNYHLLTDTATATANITPDTAVGVTFTAADKVYDGTTAATISSYLLTGVDPDDEVTLTGGTVTFDEAEAGAGTVTWDGFALAGTDAGNYVLGATAEAAVASITAKPVTVIATAADKVYDGTAATTATLSISDVLAGDTVTPTHTIAAFADAGAGEGKAVTVSGIALTGADAANYELSSDTTMTAAAIIPAPLTASFTVADKGYDATTAGTVATAGLAGIVGTDSVTLAGATAVFADKAAGAGKTVTVSGYALAGSDAANYALANNIATGTADITPAPATASFTVDDRAYDGTTDAAIASSILQGIAEGDVAALDGAAGAFATKHAGMNKTVTVSGYSLTGADAANYTLNGTASTSASITPRVLTPSVTAKGKSYDGTDVAEIDTLTGDTLAGDDVALTASAASFSSRTIGSDQPVTVSGIAIAGGADAANYQLASTTASTTADIVRGSGLAVAFTAASKTYDGTSAAMVAGYTLDGVADGDVVSVTGGTAAFGTGDAGEQTVTWSGFELAGADAVNYELAQDSATATATITPKTLTLQAAGVDKMYDGNIDAEVALSSDDVVAGDTVSLSYTAAGFATDGVGTDKPLDVSGIAIAGADAPNYTLATTTASTVADITPAPLTASFTAADKVYDGSAAAGATPAGLSGAVEGDDVTVAGASAAFADKHAGTDKTVTVSGYSLTGADAANYTVNPTATAHAAIIPRTLTVTLTAARKVYDGTTSVVGALVDNRVAGDALTVTSATPAFTNPNVGAARPVTVAGVAISGPDAGNYSLASTTAATTAAITKKTLTVKADPKTYRRGEAVPAYTATTTGFVPGQDRTALTGTLKSTVKNGKGVVVTMTPMSAVGTYYMFPSGLTSANYKIVNVKAALKVTQMAPTVAYKPDAEISLTNTTYVGAGVINTTAVGQTVTASVKRGAQKVFYVRLRNAGLMSDTLALKGCAASTGQTVTYFANATGTTGITPAVNGGTYKVTLAPGATRVVRAVVKVATTATLTARTCALKVTSTKRTTGVDAVAFKVTAIR